MKKFTFNPNHHYLFSDGVVRKKIASPSGHDQGFLFLDNGVRRIVYCANDGIPHGALVPTPHIVMCLEDPTTWDWRLVGVTDYYNLTLSFTMHDRSFKIVQTRPFKDDFYIMTDEGLNFGNGKLSDISETLSKVARRLFEDRNPPHQIDKPKTVYTELIDMIDQKLKQIERLEI